MKFGLDWNTKFTGPSVLISVFFSRYALHLNHISKIFYSGPILIVVIRASPLRFHKIVKQPLPRIFLFYTSLPVLNIIDPIKYANNVLSPNWQYSFESTRPMDVSSKIHTKYAFNVLSSVFSWPNKKQEKHNESD